MDAPGKRNPNPSAQDAALPPAATDSSEQHSAVQAVRQWRRHDSLAVPARQGNTAVPLAHQDASGVASQMQRRLDEASKATQAVIADRTRGPHSELAATDRPIKHGKVRRGMPGLEAASYYTSWQASKTTLSGRDAPSGRQLLATEAPPFTVSPAQSGVHITSPQLRINSAPTQLFQIDFGKATTEVNPVNLFAITGAVECGLPP